MKRPAVLLAVLISLTACRHGAGPASPAWTSAGRKAEYSYYGYVVRNNVWGEGPGPQTLWADSPARWGVRADHPETMGVKSYPHVGWDVRRRLDGIRRCRSRFAVSVPAAGSYNTAYDIWCEQHAYELMLWVNWQGKMGPIARSWNAKGEPAVEVANVTVGGHTWDVYKGTNGSNTVISFLRTSPATAGEVDIKAVLDWIRARGWFDRHEQGNVRLDEVQFGWEISASPGGLDFAVNDFAVDVALAPGSPAVDGGSAR